MTPHKDTLVEMIPPKKHLLRLQPVCAQIGIMEGNTFCNTLQPRLFTIDPNVNESKPHLIFVTELVTLCDMDDASLMKVPQQDRYECDEMNDREQVRLNKDASEVRDSCRIAERFVLQVC